MGPIHQIFARKKVGDTEKGTKCEARSACNEKSVVRSFDREFIPCLEFKIRW